MRVSASQRREALRREAHFFSAWVTSPIRTGAVVPSGRKLARAMAAAATVDRPGAVIELGPGTGPVTEALLTRVTPERMVLVEYNAEFCRNLRERFPDVRVIQGDAYALRQSLQGVVDGPVASVVSGLPLLTRPRQVRRQLVQAATDLMGPGGTFVQFTYSRGSPVRDLPATIETRPQRRIWWNLPAARVWTYTLRPQG